jgi:hypothetical protein
MARKKRPPVATAGVARIDRARLSGTAGKIQRGAYQDRPQPTFHGLIPFAGLSPFFMPSVRLQTTSPEDPLFLHEIFGDRRELL